MIANDDETKNVLGTKLEACCFTPKTGFYRDGFCNTGSNDYGKHIVCAIMSKEFLEFSKEMGNNLISPVPEYNFPGLKPGDKWCLCVLRWKEALQNKVAPKVILESCHQKCLKYVTLKSLQDHAEKKL